jgi:hypothetical protein
MIMRNMSFMLTAEQIRNRTKTVTRRLGWRTLKPGDRIAACKKCMGLKKGEKIEKLADLRVVSVRQERLERMLDDGLYGIIECANEGFPDMTVDDFVDFFCRSHKGVYPETPITRIEFEYCEPEALGAVA